MKRKRSKLAVFFSWNQHKRRRGAAAHLGSEVDYNALKANLIDAGQPEMTRGSSKELDTHLEALRREFSGQPELVWHHAKLIVLIRRGAEVQQTYAQLQALWDAEQAFLCQHLNIRWLASATDTIAEHDPDPSQRAVAMMTSLLVNSVKMQESERHVFAVEDKTTPNDARVAYLQHSLVPLFEGMSCFTVGTDDTLRNMVWRMQPFFKQGTAGAILETIWDRFQVEDTVFCRMRALHHRKRTAWWKDEA